MEGSPPPVPKKSGRSASDYSPPLRGSTSRRRRRSDAFEADDELPYRARPQARRSERYARPIPLSCLRFETAVRSSQPSYVAAAGLHPIVFTAVPIAPVYFGFDLPFGYLYPQAVFATLPGNPDQPDIPYIPGLPASFTHVNPVHRMTQSDGVNFVSSPLHRLGETRLGNYVRHRALGVKCVINLPRDIEKCGIVLSLVCERLPKDPTDHVDTFGTDLSVPPSLPARVWTPVPDYAVTNVSNWILPSAQREQYVPSDQSTGSDSSINYVVVKEWRFDMSLASAPHVSFADMVDLRRFNFVSRYGSRYPKGIFTESPTIGSLPNGALGWYRITQLTDALFLVARSTTDTPIPAFCGLRFYWTED